MIVMKFGGTSVRDAERIDGVLEIAYAQLEKAPVLVSSAFAGVTDDLISFTEKAVSGDGDEAVSILEDIEKRHREAIEDTSEEIRSSTSEVLEGFFTELRSLTRGLSLLRECSARTKDAVLSFGELLSTAVILARARERGIDAEWLDSRDFIQTDATFNAASPVYEATNALIKAKVKPTAGKLLIVQGFIGRAASGATTTLGRGGSDFSATIVGAALRAEQVQIWTDVNGIMTSDPRIVDNARTVNNISYDEAAELAYFGAKVVHPSTIQPATEYMIPVLVKNTLDPDGAYTAIIGDTNESGVRAITGKKGITLVSITSSRMLNAYGFLSSIFAVFDKYKTSVDLIATSEVSVSVTIDDTAFLEGIVEDLGKFGEVGVEHDKGIVCLVGKNLWKDPSFVAKVFDSLQSTAIRMISLGASDINLSFVVAEDELASTVKTLHGSFFSAG